MSLTDVDLALGIILSGVAVAAIVAGWVKWVHPRYDRLRADLAGTRDAILGREAVRDSITGKELAPAQPGVGIRLAHQEQQMAAVTRTLERLAESHELLASHARTLEQHESRLAALEAGAIERVVTRAESTEAWRAMQAAHESGQRGDDFIDGEADD